MAALKWSSTFAMSLALACATVTVKAQFAVGGESPAANDVSEQTDYVVDIPAEDGTSGDEQSVAGESDAPQPLNAEPAEHEHAHEHAHHDHDGHDDAAATDAAVTSDKDAAPTESEDEAELIKERFPNGSIKIEREVTQDTQGNYVNHGAWKMYDEKGNPVVQGQYEYGNRTGNWVRWYRSASEAGLLTKMPYQQFPGPFISQAAFKSDQLDGNWTIYDAKMRKISQWSFTGGKRNGPSIWWYANGKKMREAQFVNGDMEGPYLEWGADGALTTKETYQGGRKLGMKTSYHTGKVKKSEGMYLFAKDVEHSPDDWWNCKLLTTTKTGKDEKHGAWASWYTSGQRQLEGTYEHDMQIGQFSWWHANGQKALEGRFNHGKQDGTWTWWHGNGQKSIQGEYANGNPTGRWTWWKEDGKVVQSADLSQSEGVVIDMPRTLEPNKGPEVPHMSKPAQRLPLKR